MATTLVLQVLVVTELLLVLLLINALLDSGEGARGIGVGEGVLVADACVRESPSLSRGTSAGRSGSTVVGASTGAAGAPLSGADCPPTAILSLVIC